MRKHMTALLGLVAALAVPVAVFVSPAAAVTPPTCGAGQTYIGWGKGSLAVNGTVNSDITDYGNVINGPSGSNVRGEVRVDNNTFPETANMSAYIEAGVETTASGDRLFIEYKNALGSGVFTDEGAAAEGTTYNAQVKITSINNSTGYYGFTATINGHSLSESVYDGGFAFNSYKAQMENQESASGSCNAVNTAFAAHSPSGLVGATKIALDTNGNPADTTKFDQLYYTPTQTFSAYSPWVPDGCSGGGPC